MISKSDPYFELSFENKVEYRSEVAKSTQDPKWAPFTIHFAQLGGPNNITTISVYDFDEAGKHQLIGTNAFEVYNLISKFNLFSD